MLNTILQNELELSSMFVCLYFTVVISEYFI